MALGLRVRQPFTRQIFTDGPPCAKHCPRCLDYLSEQGSQGSLPYSATYLILLSLRLPVCEMETIKISISLVQK